VFVCIEYYVETKKESDSIWRRVTLMKESAVLPRFHQNTFYIEKDRAIFETLTSAINILIAYINIHNCDSFRDLNPIAICKAELTREG